MLNHKIDVMEITALIDLILCFLFSAKYLFFHADP